jgi:O-antigen ligase
MELFFNRFNLLLGDKSKLFLVVFFSSFLLLSVFLPKYSEIFAVFMFLFGFFALKGLKGNLAVAHIKLYEKWLLGVFAVYGLVSIISFLYWPATRESHMRVEDDLKFLICIFLYLLLRRYEFNLSGLICVFVVFTMMMGASSMGQFAGLPLVADLFAHDYRPSAAVNPMRYAAIALIVSCFMINFCCTGKSKDNITKFTLTVAVVMGFIACILTQTRGIWLAIPLLALLYGCYFFRNRHRKYLIATLFGVVLIVGLGFQVDFVQKRVNKAFENIEKYQGGDGRSSIGARLDMYNASLILVKARPTFGHGLGVFKQKSKALKKRGRLGVLVAREVGLRKTPHNEFFQALVERGSIGLIVTILLFAVPGFIFYRAVKSKSDHITFYGLCGLSMLTVFFVAGQTGTLFNHNLFTNFYIIMVLLFVSQIRVLEDKEEKAGLVEG